MCRSGASAKSRVGATRPRGYLHSSTILLLERVTLLWSRPTARFILTKRCSPASRSMSSNSCSICVIGLLRVQ
jgi:hypothetical protein